MYQRVDRTVWFLATAVICAGLVLVVSAICLATPNGDDMVIPWDTQPVWSPDGTKIAFVSTRNGPDGAPDGPENIWVVNADGTNMRQLTFDGASEYPTWSPDGSKIAYQRGACIMQVDIVTEEISIIGRDHRGGFEPDWHPTDASKIATCFRTMGHDTNIMLMNPETCMTELSGRVTLLRRDGTDTTPRWSRDGTRIAFIGEMQDPEGEDSDYHLMTMDADGSNLQIHSEIRWSTKRLSWFLDGNRILDDRGNVHNLTTGEVTSLFGEYLETPDISRDGTRVSYADFVGLEGTFIFVRNIDGTGKQQITNMAAQPSFDPDEGTYDTEQSVTITCSTQGVTIRYTTDGTEPTESSTEYTSPISIGQTMTLKARAWKAGYCPSPVKTADYVIQ